MTTERENDQELADGWTPEAVMEYEQWRREQDALPFHEATYDDYLAAMDADLPPHKRRDYAERMACQADDLRKAQRENALK